MPNGKGIEATGTVEAAQDVDRRRTEGERTMMDTIRREISDDEAHDRDT
jgi:hypothetical protein